MTLTTANHSLFEVHSHTTALPAQDTAENALDIFLAIGICAVLAFGPLAFGAVQPWSMFTLEIAVSLLFVTWAFREVVSGGFHISAKPAYIPIALLAAVVLIQIAFHTTAYSYITESKALLWASYGGIFFLVSQIFSSRARLIGFGYFCAGYGFLVSAFAIIQQFTSNGKIYWVVGNRHGGWIYGPYVNHAHYAGLMEMLIPFPLILAITQRGARSGRALLLFAAVVMGSTIFLSLSLGGMIAFCAEMVVLLLVLFRSRQSSSRDLLVVGVVCIALIVWLAWLRPAGLMDRIARLSNPITDAGATGRVAIVKDSLKMVVQRPVLGWGLGTFPIVYPSFRSFYTNLWVNEAHNDYVQTMVETGIVGFAFTILLLIMMCNDGIRNLKKWRDDEPYSLSFAAFLGCIGILIHGFVDFNLQIPANAAFFFALCAIVTTRYRALDPQRKPVWSRR